jgi:hypothetical protein
MTQVIRVSDSYKINAANGTITLDTGNNRPTGDIPTSVGNVVIIGNLLVEYGSSTNIEVTNLNVSDRVITLNTPNALAGISNGTGSAGIEIDRGTENNVSLLYSEISDAWEFQGSTSANSRIRVKEITTDVNNGAAGDLLLIGDHVGVLTVPTLEAPLDYKTQIINRGRDDDIPNKGYVDYAIDNRPPGKYIGSDNSEVRVRDKDIGGDGVSVSIIAVKVDDTTTARFYNDKTLLHSLEFRQNIIENTNSNDNIRLLSNGTGKLETNYAIQLDQIMPIDPSALVVADTTVIYSSPPAAGESGIYFVNETKTTGSELISKNKALVFSMLF